MVATTIRGVSSMTVKASTSRLDLSRVQQRREIHFEAFKQKVKMIQENKHLWLCDINNTALKYGLFGVSVGTPTTWVVSLISWMNQLGLPWWGAITGGENGLRR